MYSQASLIHDYLSITSLRIPDKIALVCDEQRLTYGQIDQASSKLALSLRNAGAQRGDRIAIFAHNSVETVISFWAVMKANCVLSIINPLNKEEKLNWMLNNAEAKIMITDMSLAKTVANTLHSVPSLTKVFISGSKGLADIIQTVSGYKIDNHVDVLSWEDFTYQYGGSLPALPRENIISDLAMIIYTSGTTGEPKGVMMNHENMLFATESVNDYLNNREDDVIMNTLSMAFSYGLYQMILAFKVGATLVLERSFAFPSAVLNKMVEEKVTAFPGVPSIFSVIAGMKDLSKFDLSSLRYLTNAAGPLAPRYFQFLKSAFPNTAIFSMYGQTECKRGSYLPHEDFIRKPGSIGIPLPNTEFWIIDQQGNRLPPGKVGELVIRGRHVMQGYWKNPELTASKLHNGSDYGEKELHTGDLARMDEEGYLYFESRMDDIINISGEKVAPKEIENVLYRIPEVKEVAVIGVDDAVLGQVIKAYIVLHESQTKTDTEILRFCSKHLSRLMLPKYIKIVDSLPKTVTGKIRKIDLSYLD